MASARTSKARFLAALFVSSFVSLGTVALFNVAIDPYGIFGSPRIAGLNAIKPRPDAWLPDIKQAIAVKRAPQILILGNSRAEIGFDPVSEPFQARHAQPYNMAVPGLGLAANLAMLQKVGDNARPKLLIVGVEFLDFLNTTAAIHPSRPEASKWQPNALWFKALFTLQAMRDSLNTLRLQHVRYPATLTPLGFNPLSDYEEIAQREGYYAIFKQRAGENGKSLRLKAMSLPTGEPLDRNEFAALRTALQNAARWESEVHLVIYPYHAQLLLMFDDVGLWPAFEEFKRQLVLEADRARSRGCNVTVWDFSPPSRYTIQPVPAKDDRPGESPWYWEAGHFKKELGDLILKRLLRPNAAGPDFGQAIRGESIERHLAQQRVQLQHLRSVEHRLAVEARQSLSALAPAAN